MIDERRDQAVRIYFVPAHKVRQAIVAMQYTYGHGFSWVKSCDYLKDDNKFAVQVVFSAAYPYLHTQFEEWETS